MEEIAKQIGQNLKNIRLSLDYSLDNAAELTGVSKSMLGQIERGTSTPTVKTLWKISNGLKVSFSSLMDDKHDKTELIRKEELAFIENERYKVYTYVGYKPEEKIETFVLELNEGSTLDSEAHTNAIFEYVYVLEGEMQINVGGESFQLKKDEMLKFPADQKHSYLGLQGVAKVLLTITYS